MAHIWEQKKNEPTLWYKRFVELYLTIGDERTLEGAYRVYRTRRANGAQAVRESGQLRPPGDWSMNCAKWSWVSRAQAYDAHQAILLRRAYANTIKRTNEKHLAVIQNHFTKLIQQTQKLDYSKVTDIGQMLQYTKELINIERMLMGMPLQVAEVQAAPQADPAIARAVQESAAERIDNPEMIAEVFKILDAQGCFADDQPDAADPKESA
uniref:hypothetical protein n=1 Tax=Paludisphaera borealis TaxID=1387353 RepID=UPI00284C7173|nr:hypothetical protein [Paludisphaera borealis]MDR3618231.1 hypothetical protein [Paludisphaera borealis]